MSDTNEIEVDITKAPVDTQDQLVELTPVEPTTGSEDNSEDVDGEDTTSQDEEKAPKKRSNKSNFKNLAKSNKAKDKKIAALEAKLEKQSDDDGEEDEDDIDETPNYDRVDLLEFITDTEGALEYKDQIKEALEEFPGIDFDKALKFAKAQGPQTSSSHSNFSSKSGTPKNSKKLKDLNQEEIARANLSPEQLDTWRNSQIKETNPFA